MLNIKKKEKILSELQENFRIALSAVVASLNGVTANAMNQLRKEARVLGVFIKVVPNTLLRRAVFKTSYECLLEFFTGESVIAFSMNKPNDAPQIFLRFSKEYEYFKIRGAAFEGKFINADQINLLSNLPDYKESVLKFIFALKMISIGTLIKVLKHYLIKKV